MLDAVKINELEGRIAADEPLTRDELLALVQAANAAERWTYWRRESDTLPPGPDLTGAERFCETWEQRMRDIFGRG